MFAIFMSLSCFIDGSLLAAKTTMKITKHQIFNYFHRFRHSTVLKVSGGNIVSLVLETSKGNNPTMETIAKLETFWKTMDKYNFNIKQNYLWTKYSVVNNDVLFDSTPGTNYTISLYEFRLHRNASLTENISGTSRLTSRTKSFFF